VEAIHGRFLKFFDQIKDLDKIFNLITFFFTTLYKIVFSLLSMKTRISQIIHDGMNHKLPHFLQLFATNDSLIYDLKNARPNGHFPSSGD